MDLICSEPRVIAWQVCLGLYKAELVMRREPGPSAPSTGHQAPVKGHLTPVFQCCTQGRYSPTCSVLLLFSTLGSPRAERVQLGARAESSPLPGDTAGLHKAQDPQPMAYAG